MTTKEKAIAYDKAIEKIKYVMEHGVSPTLSKEDLQDLFPELQESEDERIREAIHIYLDWLDGRKDYAPKGKYTIKDMIAWLEKRKDYVSPQMVADAYLRGCNDTEKKWLEKQGEHRSCDSIELKFKVGDWIIFNEHHNGVYQVEKIQGLRYYLRHYTGASMLVHIDNQFIRHWTFLDARDGDVLTASDGSIFIFKEVVGNACKHYVALAEDNETIQVNDNLEHYWESAKGVRPATKEQIDILFQKMKENNLEWDAENKELKKIENSPILSNSSKTGKNEIKWTEKDDYNVCCCIDKIEHDIANIYPGRNKELIEWLKSLKQRMEH